MSNFKPSGVKFLMHLAWARLDGGDFKVLLQNEKSLLESKSGVQGGEYCPPLHYPHQNNVEQDLVTPLGVLVWLGRLCTAASLKSQKIALSGISGFFCQKGGSNLLRINIFNKKFFWIKQALKASKQSWFFNVIIIQPYNTYLNLSIALLFHI